MKRYLRKHGYEPFEIPRDFNGVGTIYKLEKGIEIVWRTRQGCLPDIPVYRGNVFPPSFSEDKKIALGLMKVKDDDEATSELKWQKIVKVKIDFVEAFSEMIEPGKVINDMIGGKITEYCTADLAHKDSYLIVDVIGAKQMKYEFIKENQLKLELDKSFVQEKLGLIPDVDFDIKGKTQLVINRPAYIGYKAIRIYEVIERDEQGREVTTYEPHSLPAITLRLHKKASLKKDKKSDEGFDVIRSKSP